MVVINMLNNYFNYKVNILKYMYFFKKNRDNKRYIQNSKNLKKVEDSMNIAFCITFINYIKY